MGLEQAGKLVTGQGLARGEHADHPGSTVTDRRLDRRLHGDHRHRIALAQQPDCHAGGGIAGHHQGLGVALQQEFGDRDAAGLDDLPRSLTIGGIGRIGHVEQVFLGEFTPQLAQDAQPAYAGIEDADGPFSGHQGHPTGQTGPVQPPSPRMAP